MADATHADAARAGADDAGTTAAASFAYDGWDARALALELALPHVVALERTGSTLDVAHALAAQGTPAGTLVLADRQTAGRGRGGKQWSSPPGSGIWLTLVERPRDPAALEVLSLRLGLRAAAVLDRYVAGDRVRLKWPNDLYVDGRKLAGVLTEARWRESRVEWVALGVGINVVPPADVPTAAGLEPGTRRVELLAELVPALRSAAFAGGALTPAELDAFADRDAARGRRCVSPSVGTVEGITPAGELRVRADDGTVALARGGSLIFDGEEVGP